MARYGTASKLKPNEAIDAAVAYFGPDGLGLEVQEQGQNCVTFAANGGYVSVFACEPEETSSTGSELELETREWDYDVRQFMGKV